MKKLHSPEKHFFPTVGTCLLWLLILPWFNPVQAQKIKVDNIRYELKEDNIEILYDLVGLPSKTYNVSVVLKREQDPGFSFTPNTLSGYVGKGNFAGNGRKIIWNFANEFKPEAGVTDYYFEITAKKSSKAWMFIAGGGILVGGGIVAAILLLGNKDEPDPVIPSKLFPIPARP